MSSPADTAVATGPRLRIGPHALDTPVVLAPMAGVTNAPFRSLCRRYGAGLYVSEMISARGMVEGQGKTRHLAAFAPDESPRSIQLYGTDPDVMAAAVTRLVDEVGAEHVDLNFGCPVRKVTRHGGGAALPWRRRLYGSVVEAAVRAAGNVPVTVKLRMGLDDAHLTFLDAGTIAADAGAAAVALHARTAEQAYSGSARWEAIGELKAHLAATHPELPVLGNGDIWVAADAVRMIAETGCDGVVVGRGCLGRPWLFADLATVLDPGADRSDEAEPTAPAVGGVIAALREHARLLTEWHGETKGVRDLRKHVGWYLQGYPVGPAARRRLVESETLEQFESRLDDLDPTITLPPEAVGLPRGHQHGPRPVTVPHGFWADRDDPRPLGRAADALTSGG